MHSAPALAGLLLPVLLTGCGTGADLMGIPAPPSVEPEPATATDSPRGAAEAEPAPGESADITWSESTGPIFDWRTPLEREPADAPGGGSAAADATEPGLGALLDAEQPAPVRDLRVAAPAEPPGVESPPQPAEASAGAPQGPGSDSALPPWSRLAGPVFDWRTTEPEPALELDQTPQTLSGWQRREQEVLDLPGWRLTGRVAINSPDESWSAVVRWQQAGDAFQVRLSNPLGQGLMNLRGQPGDVYLQTAEGDIYHAPDAETLLRDVAGMRMPVSGLRYWVLAVSDPQRAGAEVQVDSAELPTALDQAGWHIEYERYRRTTGVSLPDRLSFEGESLRGRLVITQWEVTEP